MTICRFTIVAPSIDCLLNTVNRLRLIAAATTVTAVGTDAIVAGAVVVGTASTVAAAAHITATYILFIYVCITLFLLVIASVAATAAVTAAVTAADINTFPFAAATDNNSGVINYL